ncbi:gag-asp_proteas domain-containing protein [Gossypium australe]|uniref:Gag-asp_proteas domain-containing protein n=1 Tax=Gossypium australe TaxID=47621 RepID=A0A5B6VN05_9ROSI|nr:gag-asp_proteas domain-containing protein [Gossypium australe]
MKRPTTVQEMKSTKLSCIYCREDHVFDECPSNQISVYYMRNFNRNNNPYSNTYNPGWKQHLNFSWNNQRVGNSNNNVQQNSASSSSAIETLLKEYMAKNDVAIQNQVTSLRALEN